MATTTFLGITMNWTGEAMAAARETGLNMDEIASDIGRVRSGADTREDLLARCLDGADADRVKGWTDYVDAVVDAAEAPAHGVKVGDGWEPAEIAPGEDEVTVRLDSPNGPKATYLRTTTIEEVLAALPAGWTVHEGDWSNAVQIDDLTWSVPLTSTGRLVDYQTTDVIRPATADELAASRAAAERDGGRGVIEVDGRRCYVEE